MKKIFGLMILALLLVAFTTPAGATTLSYTDTAQFGNSITYTLDYSLISGSNYKATFTVDATSGGSSGGSVGWFTFATSGGTDQAVMTTYGIPSSWGAKGATGSDPYFLSDPQMLQGGTQQNPNFTNIGQQGSSGFFDKDLEQSTYNGSLANALLVYGFGGADKVYTFTFDMSDPNMRFDYMPFQVGYYIPGKNDIAKFDGRLSVDLGGGTSVPEPSTLLLLGSGLLGLALAGRKLFRA